MDARDVAFVRHLVEEGHSDEEIAEIMDEREADAVEFRTFGDNRPDEDHSLRWGQETFGRNDAGEWIGLM